MNTQEHTKPSQEAKHGALALSLSLSLFLYVCTGQSLSLGQTSSHPSPLLIEVTSPTKMLLHRQAMPIRKDKNNKCIDIRRRKCKIGGGLTLTRVSPLPLNGCCRSLTIHPQPIAPSPGRKGSLCRSARFTKLCLSVRLGGKAKSAFLLASSQR